LRIRKIRSFITAVPPWMLRQHAPWAL